MRTFNSEEAKERRRLGGTCSRTYYVFVFSVCLFTLERNCGNPQLRNKRVFLGFSLHSSLCGMYQIDFLRTIFLHFVFFVKKVSRIHQLLTNIFHFAAKLPTASTRPMINCPNVRACITIRYYIALYCFK